MIISVQLSGDAAITYTIDMGDGGITSTSYTGEGGLVIIPPTIANLTITAIGDCAFYFSDVTGVNIPATVTHIGDAAFSDCYKLKSATFHSDAPTMGAGVFAMSARGFTVNYYAGAKGITAPLWLDSTDLQHWSATAVTVSAPDANGNCTATPPVAAGSRFLRLVVSH